MLNRSCVMWSALAVLGALLAGDFARAQAPGRPRPTAGEIRLLADPPGTGPDASPVQYTFTGRSGAQVAYLITEKNAGRLGGWARPMHRITGTDPAGGYVWFRVMKRVRSSGHDGAGNPWYVFEMGSEEVAYVGRWDPARQRRPAIATRDLARSR